ncbi:MAG: acylphosphatase [bacterium]
MKYIRYTVSGRVQGVGFRHHVFLKALSIGATGYVRNLYPNQVEVVIDEASTFNVPMLKLILDGPPLARVAYIDTDEMEFASEIRTFSIR